VLGIAGYLREFVRGYAEIVHPLNELKKKGQRWRGEWSELEEESWSKLKSALREAPVLENADWKEKFYVAVDASQRGVGGVLYQREGQRKRIIALTSRVLTKGQRNYSAPKRELWGLVNAIAKFRRYLVGRKFEVETDHKALVYMHRSSSHMVLDWLEQLQKFDFTVTHMRGVDNILPDALSRVKWENDGQEEEEEAESEARICTIGEKEAGDKEEEEEWEEMVEGWREEWNEGEEHTEEEAGEEEEEWEKLKEGVQELR
jgi:phospholipid-translocating ATPase